MNTNSDFNKSRIALRYWLLGRGWDKASAALEFASAHHTGTRKDGVTPEMAHQVQVAHYVRTLNVIHPEETIAAAFLHDVREDYGITDSEIRTGFGDLVADAVHAMTKEFMGEKFEPARVFGRITADPIASVVKGADRIHNQHTAAGVFSPEKICEYIQETNTHILPMLHQARTSFPTQEPAYENLKFVLLSQMGLLKEFAQEQVNA